MTDDTAHDLVPLTERILRRLPGPRRLWLVAWVLIPAANAGLNLLLGAERTSPIWEQNDLLVALNYAALTLAVAVAIWGAERLVARVAAVEAMSPLPVAGGRRSRFGGMDDVAGPMLAAVATALAFGISAYVRDGVAPAVVRGVSWFLLGIAIWTFLWVYGSLQLGLDRIGRAQLPDDVPRIDPSLGLRHVGDLAFAGLWMLLVWLVPVVLTGLPDVPGFVIGMLVLAAGLGAFFLSLSRLHRQMKAVKDEELAAARALLADAYEPLRLSPSLETLREQQPLLSAADTLEKRAHAIHEWPVDEGTFGRVATIATSVTAMTVARLILEPVGL